MNTDECIVCDDCNRNLKIKEDYFAGAYVGSGLIEEIVDYNLGEQFSLISEMCNEGINIEWLLLHHGISMCYCANDGIDYVDDFQYKGLTYSRNFLTIKNSVVNLFQTGIELKNIISLVRLNTYPSLQNIQNALTESKFNWDVLGYKDNDLLIYIGNDDPVENEIIKKYIRTPFGVEIIFLTD